MDINLFSKHFYPENFFINHVVEDLIKNKGHKFNIITAYPYYNLDKNISLTNINIFFNQKINRCYSFIPKKKNLINISLNYLTYLIFTFLYSIKLIFKKSDCNFVFATSPIFQALPALFLSRLKKIPTVIWVQDLWPEVLLDHGYKNKFLIFLIKKVSIFIYKSSNKLLVQNNEYKKYLVNEYKLTNVEVVHNPSPFNFNIYSTKLIKKDHIHIAYSGNIGKSQNLINICKSIKKFNKKIKFFIIGSGSEKKMIQKYVIQNKLQNNLIIIDHMSEKNLFKLLLDMDYLFISLKEGLSLSKTIPGKLSMYISLGKPIIAMAPGVVNNFINENNLGVTSDNLSELELLFSKLSILNNNEKSKFYQRCKSCYDKFFKREVIISKIEEILFRSIKE